MLHNFSTIRGPPLLYPDVPKERRAAKKAVWGEVRRGSLSFGTPRPDGLGLVTASDVLSGRRGSKRGARPRSWQHDSQQPGWKRPERPCSGEQNTVLAYNGVSISLKKEGHPNRCHNPNNLADVRRSERSQTQEDSRSPQW